MGLFYLKEEYHRLKSMPVQIEHACALILRDLLQNCSVIPPKWRGKKNITNMTSLANRSKME